MNIMLTVSYAIDIPRDAFFSRKSGVVNEEIMRRLETLFPKEIALTESADAHRTHVIHYPLLENKIHCAVPPAKHGCICQKRNICQCLWNTAKW